MLWQWNSVYMSTRKIFSWLMGMADVRSYVVILFVASSFFSWHIYCTCMCVSHRWCLEDLT